MHPRYTILLGIGQLVTWGLTYYVPAIAIHPVAESFGTGTGPVIGAFSLALLLTGLASPFVCRRIDRLGGRGPLLGGLMFQVSGLLVMAASPGLAGWYAGWALAGLGMAGGLYDAAFATAGRALGASARPTITGITLIGGFASTLGWPLGAALLPLLGWRLLLTLYAGLLLLICGPMYLALPRTVPPPLPAAPARAGQPAPQRLLFWGVASFFTLRGGMTSVISVSAPALVAGLGLPLPTAILLVSLIGPAQVAMRVVQMLAGRRWSPATLTWIAAATMPAAMALPAIVTGQGWLVAVCVAFILLYGASNGIQTIARGTLPLYLFGAAGYATRIGQIALPVILAQAAAPLLTAPLLSAQPARVTLLVLAAVGVAAAACLVPMLGHRARP